jgi:hypothetical protein
MTFDMSPGHDLGGTVYEEPKRPYEDDECRHSSRFDNRGVLTCWSCGAIYDETTLEWRIE